MVVVLGTNAGFVTVRPTSDPGGGSTNTADGRAWATKDTSPSTAAKIVEIGWYNPNATEEANFEVGVYTHDSGANEPLNLLSGESRTNAKGTNAGWKFVTGLNITISPDTIYWLAFQLDDTTTGTDFDFQSSGGRRAFKVISTLVDPFASIFEDSGIAAIYAVWEEAPAGFTRKIKISGTFQDKPIKTKVGGTFVDKPIKIKVGGTFQDA